MKEYTQSLLHDPENGVVGNCFATCIRCLLEIDNDIRNFATYDDWISETQRFLKEMDLMYLCVSMSSTIQVHNLVGYHVLNGKSVRDIRHSVIGHGGEIVWDPHPSREGLVGSIDDWDVGFLVPLDLL